jgi:2'-5' RNA ligase
MRLFVAVDVDDAVRDEMRRVRGALEARLSAFSRPPRITWVSPDAAHVTVRFVGEVDEKVAAALSAAFAAAFDVERFTVRWEGLGGFPGGRSPRTLWIGATQGSDGLEAIARLVASRVDAIVAPGEARPFRGHLTLARVRDVDRRIDWRDLLATVACGPVSSAVEAVTLYRSQLSPRGPTYTALTRASLA